MKRIQYYLISNIPYYWKSKLFKVAKIMLIFIALSIVNLSVFNTPIYAASELNEQQSTITGTVTDVSGEPLPGVTVIVSGTTNGTITDIDGAYSIGNVSPGGSLTFTFIGMLSQEIAVAEKTVVNIVMEEETIGLDEVVAIGYGTTTRRNFTGAVSQVKVDESPLSMVTTTSALDLLNGVTSGVQLTQSGYAGSQSEIQVRGQRSINGDNSPLIVLDGVIFDGALESIDPGIIEEINVLKDATSLAAYGSRAANGVIMIATKRGKIGKPMISIRASGTSITPNYRPNFRNGSQYNELVNARLGYALDADPTGWLSGIEDANYLANKETDWYDMVTQVGLTKNFSGDISGGTENIRYMIGAMHNDQESFIVGDNYQRTTFNAKIETTINKYIKMSGNFNQGFSETNGESADFGGAITHSPWGEPLLSDGRPRRYIDGKENSADHPLWAYYQGYDNNTHSKSTVLGGSLDVTVPWVEGLSYKLTGTYNVNIGRVEEFTHETNFIDIAAGEDAYTTAAYQKQLFQANGSVANSESNTYTYDNILTYARDFDKHSLNGTLVYTRSKSESYGSTLTGTDFETYGNTILGIYALNNAATQRVNTTNVESSQAAYLARMIYSFDNKYQLNASVRRDGSSVFGSDKKWGTFPAVGIAWTISNESFMSGLTPVDYLKLKVSYGKNGNQALAPYGTLSTIAMGQGGEQGYIFGNSLYFGQYVNVLGNPGLAWETTEAFNAGFEADLLKNRIHLEFDGYRSKTTDQIFDRTIPVMGAGITSQQSTMGQVNNWGVEVNLSTVNVQKADFSWTSRVVFYMNRNKLVEIDGSGADMIDSDLFIGKSLSAIYGYEWIGIVQEDDVEYQTVNGAVAGDPMYANLDGSEDGIISEADRKILGYAKENFRASLSNTITYKNFQLYFLLNGVFSGGGFGMAANNAAYRSASNLRYGNDLDHPFWTAENQSNTYISPSSSDSRFTGLQRYTFIRLQDVSLNYKLSSVAKNWGLGSMSVYVAGKNLAFWAPDWEYSDPEVRNPAIPQLQRQITLGINVGF